MVIHNDPQLTNGSQQLNDQIAIVNHYESEMAQDDAKGHQSHTETNGLNCMELNETISLARFQYQKDNPCYPAQRVRKLSRNIGGDAGTGRTRWNLREGWLGCIRATDA
jgi:hypothetical protein